MHVRQLNLKATQSHERLTRVNFTPNLFCKAELYSIY